MPLIGDVDKFMAGGTAITALYAGDAKVWPLGPAAPDRTATWRLDTNGVLHLIIDGGADFPPENTSFTVLAYLFDGLLGQSQNWALGKQSTTLEAEMTWHHSGFGDMTMTVANNAYLGSKVTNSIAVRDFPGRILRITTTNGGRVTLIEVVGMGTVPPDMNAQDDQQHRVMVWDHYWADVPEYPGSALVAVVLSPVYRQVSVAGNTTHWIDAASVTHPVISFASGTNLTEGELIALVDGPGVRLYTRYGMFFVKAAT
jgi:hypothetical protein